MYVCAALNKKLEGLSCKDVLRFSRQHALQVRTQLLATKCYCKIFQVAPDKNMIFYAIILVTFFVAKKAISTLKMHEETLTKIQQKIFFLEDEVVQLRESQNSHAW